MRSHHTSVNPFRQSIEYKACHTRELIVEFMHIPYHLLSQTSQFHGKNGSGVLLWPRPSHHPDKRMSCMHTKCQCMHLCQIVKISVYLHSLHRVFINYVTRDMCASVRVWTKWGWSVKIFGNGVTQMWHFMGSASTRDAKVSGSILSVRTYFPLVFHFSFFFFFLWRKREINLRGTLSKMMPCAAWFGKLSL